MRDMLERDTTKYVFLLEDHESFRQALAYILEREPDIEVVGQAGTLEEARQFIRNIAVDALDVAVVDLVLPDGSGTELVQDLRERNPELPVLALTILYGEERRSWAESRGVDEVLSKDTDLSEIVGTIKRLASR